MRNVIQLTLHIWQNKPKRGLHVVGQQVLPLFKVFKEQI